jgi:hypothetical protein
MPVLMPIYEQLQMSPNFFQASAPPSNSNVQRTSASYQIVRVGRKISAMLVFVMRHAVGSAYQVYARVGSTR